MRDKPFTQKFGELVLIFFGVVLFCGLVYGTLVWGWVGGFGDIGDAFTISPQASKELLLAGAKLLGATVFSGLIVLIVRIALEAIADTLRD